MSEATPPSGGRPQRAGPPRRGHRRSRCDRRADLGRAVPYVRSGGQAGAVPATATEDIVGELKREHPDLKPEALADLVSIVETTVGKHLETRTAPLAEDLARVQQTQLRQQQQALVTDFNSTVDGQLDKAKVVDPFDREALRALVVNRALATHGQAFDEPKAVRPFHEINTERVQTAHRRAAEHVQGKVEESAAEAPIKHATGTASAAESLRQGLRSRDPSWGFRGSKSNKMVRQYADRTVRRLLG